MALHQVRKMGLLVVWLLAAGMGCRAGEPKPRDAGRPAIVSPLEEPTSSAPSPRPDTLKEHVYIFAVNGVDPWYAGNFNGLCDQLRGQGYRNTQLARLCGCHGIVGEIRKIHRSDPHARIVLIGYSAGCYSVRAMANTLQGDGIRVDLLVYLAGDFLKNKPRSQPKNVGRVLNIRVHGMPIVGGDLFFNRDDLGGARNVRLPCGHFDAPRQAETLALILEELTAMVNEKGS